MCIEEAGGETSKKKSYGVSRGGNVTVTCRVAANPPVTRFRWWFHSAGEAQEVKADLIHSKGSVSVYTYS